MDYHVRWIHNWIKQTNKHTDEEIKKEMSSLDREHSYPQLWTSLLHLCPRIPQRSICWQSSLPMTRWWKEKQLWVSVWQGVGSSFSWIPKGIQDSRLQRRPSSRERLILNLVLEALCAPFGKNPSYFILKNVLLCHFIAAALLVWYLSRNSYWI